jgi:C4-dicarboxylate transporter DctM subunit
MEGILTFVILFICIFISIPVSFCMIAVAVLVYLLFADIPITVVAQNMYYNVNSYAYSAVLYFVFAGTIMARGRLSNILLDIADAFVGYLPGGMAIAAVVGCGLFGAISGSDLATLAAIGGIMVPALVNRGWPKSTAVGIVGSGALLGMIIPPSIPVIIYALYVNVSVGSMFLAGILPGVAIILTFSIYLFFKSNSIPGEKFQKPDIKKMARSLKNGVWGLGMPIIIFGGIYGGITTVTEAAAVAAAYALFVELVINRELKWRDIPSLAVESALSTAVILFLVAGASVLARYLTLEQIPQMFAEELFKLVDSKWSFLLMTNLLLLIVGCLLDLVSATLILMPILQPLYIEHGIHELHFGMIFLLNLYSGYLTPPVGINLFAAAGIFGLSLVNTARAYIPFFIMLLLVLFLVVLVPWISTFIPNLVYG